MRNKRKQVGAEQGQTRGQPCMITDFYFTQQQTLSKSDRNWSPIWAKCPSVAIYFFKQLFLRYKKHLIFQFVISPYRFII